MKGKGLYSIFAVAALAAVSGFIYFGTVGNQQASVGALGKPVTPVTDGPIVTIDPQSDEIAWRLLCRDGAPHVQVLSPNGGEVYQMGQQIPLKWRSCNATQVTKMFFGMSTTLTGVNHEVTATSLVNDGSEMITIPGWVVPGNYYKMYVSLGGSPALSDFSNNTFIITKPAKLEVSTAATNPAAMTVLLAQTESTHDVVLLKFKVKAIGSDLSVSKIPVQITTTGHNVSSIVNTLKITKPNGTILATVDPSAGMKIASGAITTTAGCTTSCGFIFSLNNPIPQVITTTPYEFNIVADIKPAAIAVGGGTIINDTIKASVVNPDVMLQANLAAVTLQAGDAVPAGAAFRTGSALGNIMKFGLTNTTDVCPNIAGVQTTVPIGMIKDSAGNCVAGTTTTSSIIASALSTATAITTNPTSADDSALFTIRFRVTATNKDVYISKSATAPITIYKVDKTGAAVISGIAGTITDLTDSTVSAMGAYKIDKGSSEDFMLSVNVSLPAAGSAGNYRASLYRLAWSADDDGAYENTYTFSPALSTDYIFLN